MKNNLEQQFQDALNNYELPYNASAWSKLSERLDALDATSHDAHHSSNTSSNGIWKWIVGSCAVLVGMAFLYYFVRQTPEETKGNVLYSNETDSTKAVQSTEINNHSTITETINTSKGVSNSEKISSVAKHARPNTVTSFFIDDSAFIYHAEHLHADNQPTEQKLAESIEAGIVSDMMPEVDNSLYSGNNIVIEDRCQGDVIPIKNVDNRLSLLLISPSEKQSEIPPNQSKNYIVDEVGVYRLVTSDGKNSTTFIVKERPSVNFSIDTENRFKEGIPSIMLETHAQGNDFTWSFDNTSLQQHGRTAYAHFYKKGTHQASLTVRHNNGCITTTTKSITIEKDYNLLAPTAFVPLSGDRRTNHFIPVALLHRKTPFTMQIIDPQKGTVIFQTSTTDGWNGIDATTNQLVKENTYYIWKVSLLHPEPGEQREYKGSVTRL